MDFTANANLAIIRERWPAIGKMVETAQIPQSAVVVDSGPEKTMVVEGLHLSSRYDRQKEARLQASLIPVESELGWVYGFGLGDLPRALLLRDSLKRLNVVLMNPAVARASCQYFDHTDWLSDPRVKLLTAEGFDAMQFPFAAVPPCLQLVDDISARLRDLVLLALSTPFIRLKHGEGNKDLQRRIAQNESFAVKDGDVAELFGQRPGQTVAVAGAGPTLERHYQFLRQNRRTLCLIAVDAALKPLVEAGINPDVVLVLDGHDEKILPFFSEVDLVDFSSSPLVYFPAVHGQVLDAWPGPRLTAYSEHPLYETLAAQHPKGTLFSSGSVIHPAVDLAVKMGAAKILLLGADFSFPGEISHVEGCVVRQAVPAASTAHWLLDGRGQRVHTTLAMSGFLRDLETYIAAHRQVVFVNGSKAGAKIEGTLCMEGQD